MLSKIHKIFDCSPSSFLAFFVYMIGWSLTLVFNGVGNNSLTEIVSGIILLVVSVIICLKSIKKIKKNVRIYKAKAKYNILHTEQNK